MEEPHRRSFLDVLKHHLSVADRCALTTRFVYIGEYSGLDVDLQNRMKESVKELNDEYGEIVLTGLLVVYSKFFMHIIEASEETIYKHLRYILNENSDEMLGRMIQLPSYYNAYRMYFSGWYTTVVRNPPVLLDSIEKNELEEIKRQIKNCLFKLYSLCEYLMGPSQTLPTSTTDVSKQNESQERVNPPLQAPPSSTSVVSKKTQLEKLKEMLGTLDKDVPHYLPEVTILEYLLNVETDVIHDMRDYMIKYEETPFLHFYNDRVWPPPSGLVPHTQRSTNKQKT